MPGSWSATAPGLRNSQRLGDFVLAHAYLREDHVLDDDLPIWVPIPALAEIQVALEDAVEEVTELEGYELKRIMRTGTVATIDNRNWELRDQSGPVQRLSPEPRHRARHGERHHRRQRLPLPRALRHAALRVSDKPLHGELKLPGMASDFYRDAGRAPPDDRRPRHGAAARDAARAHPPPQIA